MLQDLITTIMEIIIDNGKPMSMSEIAEEGSFETGEIAGALNMLVDLGLLMKTKNEKDQVFTLIKKLKGIHLAKAAQIGINLNSFSKHFEINEKERELALTIATTTEKIKNLDVSKRKPLIQKRGYFQVPKHDDVSENLLALLEASNTTLYEYLEQLAEKDDYLKLLLNMHAQAEHACHHYIEGIA